MLGPPQTAFPDCGNRPAETTQSGDRNPVARLIAAYLLSPKFRACRRARGEAASRMPVPEAPMDEDRLATARKHYVRRARKIATMQAEAESQGVQKSSNCKFGRRIFAADRSHKFATCLRGEAIDHAV